LEAGKDIWIMQKRPIQYLELGNLIQAVYNHSRIHRGKRGDCLAYKGETMIFRVSKRRIPMQQIDSNSLRNSRRKSSVYGYKECNVSLCKEGPYWVNFHRNG
jgi:hypothetical protein